MGPFYTTVIILAALLSPLFAAGASPQRIVSLSPNATATLNALGISQELVGATRYCPIPAGAQPKIIGGVIDPSAETILALRPDLLVCAALRDKSFRERMTRYGIYTVELFPESYENLKRDVALLGEKTGRRERAEKILQRWSDAENSVRESLARKPLPRKPRVLITWGDVVAGRKSYLDSLIRLCGGENAAPQTARTWPGLPKEAIIAARAEILICVLPNGPKQISAARELSDSMKGNSAYTLIPAIQRGNVFSVDENSRLLYPAPTLIDAIPQLAAIIRSVAEAGK